MSDKVPTGFVKVRIDTARFVGRRHDGEREREHMAFVTPESTDPAEEWNTNAQFFARVIEGGTLVDALIKNASEIAITATDELKKKQAKIDKATDALRALVQAVEIEVDDGRGGSGYLLARLYDAREALGLPAHRRSTDENGTPYIGGAL